MYHQKHAYFIFALKYMYAADILKYEQEYWDHKFATIPYPLKRLIETPVPWIAMHPRLKLSK